MDSIKKIVFTTLLLMLLLSGCTETGNYENVFSGRVPDQEIWNANISISRSGELNSRVYAAHLVKYEDTKDMFIRDSMHIDFFENGEHTSYLIADSGMVNERNEKIIAIGNVIMVTDSGFTAYADSLFWLNESDKVYTNGAIQIYSEQDTLYGTNFESDTKLENWIIYNPLGKTSRKWDK